MNRFLFTSFSINLVLCVGFVLTGIWVSTVGQPPEFLPRLIGTTFVLGLASALVFVARFVRALFKKYCAKEY